MSQPDVRWKQRLSNFRKALPQLEKAVDLSRVRPLSDLEEQGLIQSFEFTHELAWNVMKDYFEFQGIASITGPRDATQEAFQRGLIVEGEQWMEMIKSRNKTSHTYIQATAKDIAGKIQTQYFMQFDIFAKKMLELSSK
jgi:nucleotidyltransferase substrate binding protein (TIGR01987 family)